VSPYERERLIVFVVCLVISLIAVCGLGVLAVELLQAYTAHHGLEGP
jgi:hypothetical protein